MTGLLSPVIGSFLSLLQYEILYPKWYFELIVSAFHHAFV